MFSNGVNPSEPDCNKNHPNLQMDRRRTRRVGAAAGGVHVVGRGAFRYQHFAGTAKRCRLFRQNFVMKCIERMIQAMLRVKILRHS